MSDLKQEILALKSKKDLGNELTLQEKMKLRAVKWLKQTGMIVRASEDEINLFLDYCIASNLNPLMGEIYLIPIDKKQVPFTAFSVYMQRAEASGDLKWYGTTIYKEDKNGKALPQKDWIAETTILKKSVDIPFKFSVIFGEYDKGQATWKTKPMLMFEKCSLSNAFRKAFPSVLSGLPYTIEENWSKDSPMADAFVEKVTETIIDEDAISQDIVTLETLQKEEYDK